MIENVIQTTEVEKRFGDQRVLQGVDFDVPVGSVVGLLGRNGVGKTTLLKLMLGLLKADRGQLAIWGNEAWSLTPQTKARIGYVPQTYQGYPWMNVQQVLDYTSAFYPYWNALLIDELLHQWDLDPKAASGKLSGGQRQKLGLLAALGHEPDLLVLDEPAASLDPAARRDFLEMVLSVISGGDRTVLFSTHIVSDLERVANRVAILRNGRIVYNDDLDVLKDGVKRLRIVAPQLLPRDLGIPGILQARIHGSEAVVSVLGVDRDLLRSIESRWSADVQVQDLNLEDIFVEMSHV